MADEKQGSPWAERLEPLLDREGLRKALDRRPDPIPDLNSLPAHIAVSRLSDAFNKVFVATDQRVDLALKIVEAAHAYCVSTYPDRASYVQGLYTRSVPSGIRMLYIISGLAGVGKSTLMSRLAETMPRELIVRVDHEPSEFVIQVHSQLRVGLESSVLQSLLNVDLCPQELRDKQKANVGEVAKELKRQAYLRGVAYVHADELQHFTKSSEANTLVTELLLHLCDIGPPAYAVMNYSLGHRLKKRNHEDGDRLLSRPLLLEPELKDSNDWVASIQARIDVCPQVFTFDARVSATTIHALTFAIDRYLSRLFELAYERQRRAGAAIVTVKDLTSAYASAEFSYARETLIKISRLRLDPALARSHPDITCPFPRDEARVAAERADAMSQKEEQRSAARMNDSLSAKEASAFKAMQKASAAASADDKRETKPGVKTPVTSFEMLKGLEDFVAASGKRGRS